MSYPSYKNVLDKVKTTPTLSPIHTKEKPDSLMPSAPLGNDVCSIYK